MKIEREIIKLRKKIVLLNLRVNHLVQNNKKLKNLISEKKGIRNSSKGKRISYIDRIDIERRMKNLMQPE